MDRVFFEQGQLLTPVHLQAQTRYGEALARMGNEACAEFPWGFQHLSIDDGALASGKLRLMAAAGLFRDGTPFSYPAEGVALEAIDVSEDLSGKEIFLCLRSGAGEGCVSSPDSSRFAAVEVERRSENGADHAVRPIMITQLQLRLRPEGDEALEDCHRLGVCRIARALPGQPVQLDNRYIPTSLNALIEPRLLQELQQIRGLLESNRISLSDSFVSAASLTPAEVPNFQRYLVVSRYIHLLRHLESLDRLHPERLYSVLVQLAGELGCFEPEKQVEMLAPYRHEAADVGFDAAVGAIRAMLGGPVAWTARQLDLEQKGDYLFASLPDEETLASSYLCLGVQSAADDAAFRDRFKQTTLIGRGSEENMHVVRGGATTQVRLTHLVSKPLAIPATTAGVWFRLEEPAGIWEQIKDDGRIGIYAGEQERIELWVVKR